MADEPGIGAGGQYQPAHDGEPPRDTSPEPAAQIARAEEHARATQVLRAQDAGYSKGLHKRQLQMIAMGGAIGTGLFLGAGARLNLAGPSLAIVYAFCGLFAFVVVRALGELVLHRPSSGSFVSYAREFIGEKGAYTAGWMYFLVWATGGIADVTAVALYVRFWSPFAAVPQWVIALIALLVILTVNLLSVKYFGALEYWFSMVKVGALVLFMLIGIAVLVFIGDVGGQPTGLALITDNGGLFPNGLIAAVLVVPGVVFAYAALEMVSIAAGETPNPEKVVPRATNSVIYRIAIFYVGSVLLLVLLLPWTDYAADESPFVTFLSRLGVPAAASIMNFVVLTAALSSVNSGLYATSRILRSMAMAGSAPGFTAKMNARMVPFGGILLVAGVYLIGIVLNFLVPERAFDIVLNFSALGILTTWAFIVICHWLFYRRARRGVLTRPRFQLPFAPYTNIITLIFLVSVLALMWADVPVGRATVLAIPVIVAMLFAGWFLVRKRVGEVAEGYETEFAAEPGAEPAGGGRP